MNKRLRIAMLVGSFPAVSETFILRQITGLIDLGHLVDIYADVREENVPLHPEIAKYDLLSRVRFVDGPIESTAFEMPVLPFHEETWPPGSETSISNRRRLAKAAPRFLSAFWKHPILATEALRPSVYGYRATSLSTIYRLAKLSESWRRYDIVHAHFGPVGNMFRFARQLWKAPLVVSFHGYDFCTVPRREGQGVYQQLFPVTDAVTVNSDYTRGRVQALGAAPERIHKLPVGLDPSAFPYRERTPRAGGLVRILTVARLVEIKGIEFAIRGLAIIAKRVPSIRYDVIGDGPLRAKLQSLICELGVESIVTLHGPQGGDEVKRLMNEADVFLLPSVTVEGDQEGQGLVLQEAQACGLPVICTNHGAFPEGILPGETGFLVPERNPPALAEAIEWLIKNSSRWPEISRKGREFAVAHYDIRHLNNQLVGIYEKTIHAFKEAR